MDKPAVGLPKNFSINVQTPIEIGDYLDETSLPPKRNTSEIRAEESALARDEESRVDSPLVTDSVSSPVSLAGVSNPSTKKRQPRRQINMSRETKEKLDQIVKYVQEYGPQEDAAVSEIVEAIINVQFESLSRLKFGAVRPRGAWGSRTAIAFRHSLAQAFATAVTENYG